MIYELILICIITIIISLVIIGINCILKNKVKNKNVIYSKKLSTDIYLPTTLNLYKHAIYLLIRHIYIQAHNGYKINLHIIDNINQYYTNNLSKLSNDTYTYYIYVPKYIFLSLLIDEEAVKSKTIIDFVNIIFANQPKLSDNLSNNYNIILYYKIYDYLRYKYNLKQYDYDKEKINKILNTKLPVLKNDTEPIIPGIYDDGSVLNSDLVPYNINQAIEIFDSILYIRNYELKNNKNTEILNENLEILFNTIIPFIYGKYINYNGLGKNLTTYYLKYNYKQLLYNISLYNPLVKDYEYFDDIMEDKFYNNIFLNTKNYFNVNKMYLLKNTGTFAWYGQNYDIYIINCYKKI